MTDAQAYEDASTGTWCETTSDLWAEICTDIMEAELAAMLSAPYHDILELPQPTNHFEPFVGQMDVGPGAGAGVNWVCHVVVICGAG